jgi:hypothetical protein
MVILPQQAPGYRSEDILVQQLPTLSQGSPVSLNCSVTITMNEELENELPDRRVDSNSTLNHRDAHLRRMTMGFGIRCQKRVREDVLVPIPLMSSGVISSQFPQLTRPSSP